ncbi:hypothetical protein AB0G79_20245 [Streptomyces sp. NPDC020807]|uniref:hypothetical protein n=1 Tax=Streptomyces sp. NPDC020807 TaxID=3155119 RepID=UPI003404F032
MTDDELSELHRRLGEMIVWAGRLEFMIAGLTAKVASVPPHGEEAGRSVTTNIRYLRDASVTRDGKTLMNECLIAFERRNQYVHGTWIGSKLDGTTPLVTVRPAKPPRKGQRQEKGKIGMVSAEDLGELTMEFVRLTNAVGVHALDVEP